MSPRPLPPRPPLPKPTPGPRPRRLPRKQKRGACRRNRHRRSLSHELDQTRRCAGAGVNPATDPRGPSGDTGTFTETGVSDHFSDRGPPCSPHGGLHNLTQATGWVRLTRGARSLEGWPEPCVARDPQGLEPRGPGRPGCSRQRLGHQMLGHREASGRPAPRQGQAHE